MLKIEGAHLRVKFNGVLQLKLDLPNLPIEFIEYSWKSLPYGCSNNVDSSLDDLVVVLNRISAGMNASSSTSNLNSLLRENVTGNRNESTVKKTGSKQRREEKSSTLVSAPALSIHSRERHILARRAKIGFDKSAVCSHLKPPVC